MTELEKTKYQAIKILQNLCVRCKDEVEHNCRVDALIREVDSLNGIPIIVNSKLHHVVFSN